MSYVRFLSHAPAKPATDPALAEQIHTLNTKTNPAAQICNLIYFIITSHHTHTHTHTHTQIKHSGSKRLELHSLRAFLLATEQEIGRASWRDRVCKYI